MGMYTQVRGWLNVDSIGSKDNFKEINSVIEHAKEEFKAKHSSRTWVCEDTTVVMGGNHSVYVFFGTELKNYEQEAQTWVRHLISYLPTAEGRIDFQYEEEAPIDGSESIYWLIRNGEVISEGVTPTWCEGYGNMWKYRNE